MGLKRLLTPPIFEDSETTRQVRLFNIIVVLTSITTLIPALIVVVFPTVSWQGLLPIALILFTGIGTLMMAHKGNVQLAGVIFCFVSWLAIMTTALFFGGVDSSAFNYVILVVLAAGLLLGWRMGSGLALLSIAAGLGLLYLENNNLLPPTLEIPTLLNIWANRTAILIMTITLVYAATSTINDALKHGEENQRALADERNLLRTIINNIPDYIYVKDLEARFVIVNSAVLRNFNTDTPADVIGKRDLDLSETEVAAQYYADDILVMGTGQPLLNKIEQGLDLAGNVQWLLTTKVPLQDNQGKITGLVGITRNITEQKLADDELRQVKAHLEELVAERTAALSTANEQLHREIEERKLIEAELYANEIRLRQVINLIPHRIFAKDRDGRYLLANQALADAYGVTVETLLGRTNQFLSPETLARLYQDDHDVINSGHPKFILEQILPDKDGNLRILQTTKIPFSQPGSQQPAVLGISIDITQQKQIQEQIQQQAEQRRQLLEASQAMLSTLSLDTVVKEMANTLHQVLNYYHCILFWLDETAPLPDRATYLKLRAGSSHQFVQWPMPPGYGIVGQVAQSGQGQLVNNIHLDPRTFYIPGHEKVPEHLLCLPVKTKAQDVQAVFNIYRPQNAPFTQEEFELAQLFVALAAIAIQNAQLYSELQRRLKEQTALKEASTAISSTLNLQTVLSRIAQQLGHIINATSAYICALELDIGEAIVLAEYVSPEANALEQVSDLGASYSMGESFPESLYFLEAGNVKCLYVDDPLLPEKDRNHLMKYGVKSVLNIPIIIGGQVTGYGVIWESRYHRHFTDEEIALCWAIAQHAAVAIENARLYHQAQQEIAERKQVEAIRNQLESQLLQSQKMEAIGQLAGGVAHDFNNLLTAIMGYASFASESLLTEQHPAYADIQGIQKSTQRAADLTRQLLAFARRQMVEPTIIDLNGLLGNMDHLLRRLIRADIDLRITLGPDLGQIKIDPNQMEQVLINMVVNACDAMPNGGQITIETANVALDQHYANQHAGVASGEYVMVVLSDTGMGMTNEVRSHIFEPFFTTKEVGKGTGLGLAMCFGIIKQCEGHIWVYSEPNLGTTFKIYLPRVNQSGITQSYPAEAGPLPRGTETILVTEDEEAVRELAVRVLKQRGYTVLEAANGEHALTVAQQTNQAIHLLVTDVVMPKMGGKLLATQLKTRLPNLKVLFISGYAGKAIFHQTLLESGDFFLPKPFVPDELVRRVRTILDG